MNNDEWIDKYGVIYSADKKRLIKGNYNLTEYQIIEGCEIIGKFAFDKCSRLKNIIIPNSVTTIGGWAFRQCTGLTSVTIPNSVTSIREYAFCNSGLAGKLTIPSSVVYIEEGAFYGCTALTEIHCKIITENINNISFLGVNKTTCKLYIPRGSYELFYQSSEKEHNFKSIIEE